MNVCAKKHGQGDMETWRQGDSEHRNGVRENERTRERETVSKGE